MTPAAVVAAQILAETGPRVQAWKDERSAHRRLRRVCAWCKDVLDEGDPGAETSHTICDECGEKERAKLRALQQDRDATINALPGCPDPCPACHEPEADR